MWLRRPKNEYESGVNELIDSEYEYKSLIASHM